MNIDRKILKLRKMKIKLIFIMSKEFLASTKLILFIIMTKKGSLMSEMIVEWLQIKIGNQRKNIWKLNRVYEKLIDSFFVSDN